MAVTHKSTPESSATSRGVSECKPLIEAAGKDIFRHNVFRITGSPVDATDREIVKHANKLMMMEELGQGASVHTGVFSLDPPATVDQIREAIRNLKDPERRLVDEFFWFWPREFGKSTSDPALQALANGDLQAAYDIWGSYEDDSTDGVVATHNKALTTQIIALDWEKIRTERPVEENQAQEIEDYWRRSFKRWERLVEDDRLWDKVTARVRQKDDAALSTGFVRRMRASLPEALDKINAELALSYAQAGKVELARLHIRFMREINQGIETVEKVAELVLKPMKTRLREQIKTAKRNVQRTPSDGPKTAKQLLDEALQCLPLFDLFFGNDHESRNDLFDEVASVCNDVAFHYWKTTGDNGTCIAMLKTVLPLASSIDLRKLIEKNITYFAGRVRSNELAKELEGVYALLKSIQDSSHSPQVKLRRIQEEVVPAIMKVANVSGVSASFGPLAGDSERYSELFNSASVVLRGISLDAWNDARDASTAVSALELALQYVRDAELRKRLQDDKQTLGQLHARQAAQDEALRLDVERREKEQQRKRKIGWAVGVGFVGLIIISSLSSNNRNTSSNASSTAVTPEQPSSYTPPPTVYSPPPSSYGNTYRVPSYMTSELNRDSQAIETQRARLKGLKREIDAERLLLDDTSQWAIDEFNAKVGRYNAMRQSFNQMVDSYNEKLSRNGR